MQVRYINEYGAGLYWGTTTHPIPAMIGDTVIIEDEEYRVKSRIFYPEKDVLVIELTQALNKSVVPDNEVGDRLKEMQRAIVEVNKRQDAQDKKSRSLKEQLVSVRTHLRTQQK